MAISGLPKTSVTRATCRGNKETGKGNKEAETVAMHTSYGAVHTIATDVVNKKLVSIKSR